jgi:hypothetical protein
MAEKKGVIMNFENFLRMFGKSLLFALACGAIVTGIFIIYYVMVTLITLAGCYFKDLLLKIKNSRKKGKNNLKK